MKIQVRDTNGNTLLKGETPEELDILSSAHVTETRLVHGDLFVTLCCTSYDPEKDSPEFDPLASSASRFWNDNESEDERIVG